MSLFSCLFFSLSSSLAQPTSTLFPYNWNDRSIFTQGLTSESQSVLNELPGAPVYHLEWKLSDDLRKLDGKAEVLVTNVSDIPWNNLVFRLYPNALGSSMTANEVRVNSEIAIPTLEAENTVLRIPLPEMLAPAESVVVTIIYTLEIAETIEAYGRLARFDNVLSLAHAYPTLAKRENSQWETTIPSPLGDPLVADTAFFMVRVTSLKQFMLITSGQEANRMGLGYRQTVEYIAGPVRDFYLAATQTYVVVEDIIGETKVRSFVPAQLDYAVQRSLQTAIQALEFFSMYYPYPYKEFDIVAVPVEAGGVEYPGIVNIANGLYINPFGRLGVVIAHEAGHQWAFNLVGSDQIEHPWLDEALTEYLTLRYQQTFEARFSDNLLEGRRKMWETSAESNLPIGLPVDAYNEDSYGDIVYAKGLIFFEALADFMGKDKLDEALKIYFATYAWKFAEPQDFQAVLESTCVCDLDPLFTQWVE